MPTITFSPTDRKIETSEGASLMDVCEENATPILFGCGVAACGGCRVRVLDHPESLSPMEADERTLLDHLGCSEDTRLACQCRVLGDVTLEPLG